MFQNMRSRLDCDVVFDKTHTGILKREKAGITILLRNPRKFKASNSSSYIERRKGRIFRHMRYVGKLDY
jgi:monofunctional biosynthetic peptidoglycan transglycosylase